MSRSNIARGTLRLIGGTFRSRKLQFPVAEGLRPTPDRVRETLFNWLAPTIAGCRCLDLFAGSGALGLEALSRAAAEVVFVERDRSASKALEENIGLLNASGASVKNADSLKFLTFTPSAFDLVFLDPPFSTELLEPAIEALETGGWLKPNASIYVEAGKTLEALKVPKNWSLSKQKKAGMVHFGLFQRLESPSA